MNNEHLFNNSTEEATLHITHENDKIKSVEIVMPIWTTKIRNEFVIMIPVLGLPEFFVSAESEIDQAINDAVHLFILTCEKYGKGLERELESLGWSEKRKKRQAISHLNYRPKGEIIGKMMHTGNKYAHKFQLQSC